MNNIPSKIHSYNLYNDDQGGRFFGVGDECTLPDFEQLVETLSGAGILGELDDPAPGHYSNQQMEIPFRVLDEEPISLMDTTKAVKLTMRGGPAVPDVGGRHRLPAFEGGGAGQVRHPETRHPEGRHRHEQQRHVEHLLHQDFAQRQGAGGAGQAQRHFQDQWR